MKNSSTKKWLSAIILLLTLTLLPNSFALAAEGGGNMYVPEDSSVAPALPETGISAISNYSGSDSHSLSRGALPAAYDSRVAGYITSVKDQDPWGACWAFGALAAGESSMIKKGIATNSIDLSEMHLSYFQYHSVKDPLGLTSGDRTSIMPGYNNYLELGGNNLFTMFTLSKWVGAAAESTIPYSGAYQSYYNDALAYNDVAHMQNTRYVSNADMTSVKNLIQQYGAVSTSIYYNSAFQNSTAGYYFPTKTFVGTFTSNHIVTLVGWNDAYPKEKLTSTYTYKTSAGETKTGSSTPSRNGAWIVKNSYGTADGDNGYIYISYADHSMVTVNGDLLSFAFDMENANNYDYNYQYDGSSSSSALGLGNDSSIAARYTVQGKGGTNEQLDAVSFSVDNENIGYSIQVYKNPSTSNPTSGSPMLSYAQTGKTTYRGYYTIPLNEKLVFKKGDTFSVVIKLTTSKDPTIYAFCDNTTTNLGIQFTSTATAGQTYYNNSGFGWKDLNTSKPGANIRLKAFTTKTSAAVTKVENISSSLKKPMISFTNKKYNSVTLKWKKVKKAKGYQIFRSTSKYGTYKKIATTKNLTYTDKKAATGITYYYKMRAYIKKSGKTSYSYYSAVKSYKPSLAKTKLSSASSASGKKATLKWQQVTGAKGYVIYRSTDKKGKYELVKTVSKASQLTYTDKVPKKGTYYYKVRAYRKTNGKKVYGKYSAVKTVKVK